ncbi:hypothetical protein AJ79_04412 [Helicocarpus griseus UAMH5409]|uniref:Ysc84 actin-binding domain-containing protein n=1 Tax=Helicocarpus griseus UAMH5409 TaxID=1447875 RepID=A0A2B7XUB8_9EURO|nr:hypothetical protein AJ79_04412 [Helicocarpus griseus UAMH5409]
MSDSKWEKTKVYSKRGFDKAWHTLDKLGRPVNRLSNKLGAEAFWPTTLDKESDKAARILRSFCKDGFYAQVEDNDEEGQEAKNPKDNDEDGKKEEIDKPKGKQRVVKKIPSEVIKQAKGLAIFTTMRTGLWVSGSGGSGILVARNKETDEWSPPSGIMLHTAGLGFLVGADIYDCVVVINTYEALEAFKAVRCTLGGEVSAVAGPVGVGGVLETEVHKRRAPVWTYLKSRGFYAGVQVDGTIIIERSDENERFYGERIPVADILAGKAKHPPLSIKALMQTIKAAQGDTNVDEESLPPPGEAPGDAEIDTDIFGIPPPDDPDPFGVKALEKEGVIIREAGTKRIPSLDSFEFRPSPASPIYNRHSSRMSTDSSHIASWRTSIHSTTSVDRGTQTGDSVDEGRITASTSVTRASTHSFEDVTPTSLLATEGNTSKSELTTPATEMNNASTQRGTPAVRDQTIADDPSQARPTSPAFARARLVTIPKRPPPPPVPARSASRVTSSSSSRLGTEVETQEAITVYDEDVEVFEVHDSSKDKGRGKKDFSEEGLSGDKYVENIQSVGGTPLGEEAAAVPGEGRHVEEENLPNEIDTQGEDKSREESDAASKDGQSVTDEKLSNDSRTQEEDEVREKSEGASQEVLPVKDKKTSDDSSSQEKQEDQSREESEEDSEEDQSAKDEELSKDSHTQKGVKSREETKTADKAVDEPSTRLSTDEGSNPPELSKETQPTEERSSSEETRSSEKSESARSPVRRLQNESLQEDKDEFHSTPTSPALSIRPEDEQEVPRAGNE